MPVLAELLFHALAALGNRGLLLAQVVAVAGALVVLAVDMRRAGAGDTSSAVVILVAALGAVPALLVIRVQLFSLVLFPLLGLLLRSEARSPSRRIWLVPVLLALWSNLHGAVLVGLAVTFIYLAFERARRDAARAAAVGVVSLLAVCATPALEQTPSYYYGVLQNDAAQRGEGLWAPLSLTSPFDIVLIVAALLLLALALRRRPRLWELVALCALAVLTVKTARSGVWFLFFSAPPAAAALRIRRSLSRGPAFVVAGGFAIVAAYAVATGPHTTDVSDALIQATLQRADGTPVLAEGRLAERLVLAGGRVWMSNPLDAFPHRDQRLYLDWLAGKRSGLPAYAHAPRVVLVRRGAEAERLTRGSGRFRAVAADAYAALYARRR